MEITLVTMNHENGQLAYRINRVNEAYWLGLCEGYDVYGNTNYKGFWRGNFPVGFALRMDKFVY